jgi:predicted 3-demethylubiquinone-9 3-methyltransferase (glyoxalase superfamily)
MQKITPFLWFDSNAEEAASFYTSVFRNTQLGETRYYGEAGQKPAGSVMSVSFTLEGEEFIAPNGGPHFNFTPAVSFLVRCETQAEVDELWNRLTEGGEPVRCGWLKDKFGLSWQIVPTVLGDMLRDKDQAKSRRVTEAMLRMIKLDIGGLQQAYNGEAA